MAGYWWWNKCKLKCYWPLFFGAFMDLNLANIQSFDFTLRSKCKLFWLSWQSEPDLPKNEIKDLSALLTKVCRWLFITKSRLKFTPVRGKQSKNELYFNDIPLQKLFSVFRHCFRCSAQKTSVCHVDVLFFSISKERKSNLPRRPFQKSILTWL